MNYIKNIPLSAHKYISLQRTHYPEPKKTKIVKSLLRIPLFFSYNAYTAIEALLFGRHVKGQFNKDMLQEYSTMKDYLPKTAEFILDIGCGLAGIDILLNQHYRHMPEFYLMDRTKIDDIVYYGFREQAAFYNSLAVTKSFLLKNGVAPTRIHVQEVAEDNCICFDSQFDLVISIISWGYHYPISVYLDQVYELLKPNGVLIVDVRNGSGGDALINRKFKNVEIIHDATEHQYKRVLAKK